MKEETKRLIAKNKPLEAIEKLLEVTKGEFYNNLLMLKANYKRLFQDHNLNSISKEEFVVENNRLNRSLLKMVDDILDINIRRDDTNTFHDRQTSQTKKVELTIDGELANFNKTRRDDLIRVIAAILQIESNSIRIRKVIEGSIKVIIELQADKAEELIELFNNKDVRLDKLTNLENISNIKIVSKNIHKESINMNHSKETSSTEESLKGKWWRWIVAAGILLAIPAALAEFSGYSIRDFIGCNDEFAISSNSLTVLVHGKKGKDHIVLPNRGIVKVIYGDAIATQQINNNGEATFKQISDVFFEPRNGVDIWFEDPEGENYRAVNLDSIYYLKRGSIVKLKVELLGMNHIFGIVKDSKSGNSIEDAIIRVRGEESRTNKYGEFELNIPEDKQEQFITVRIYKDGYEDWHMANIPTTTEQEISVLLKPK